jgi:ABC-type transport system substrate-binding protein
MPETTPAGPAGELIVSLPARIVGLDPLGPHTAEESVRVVAAHIFDTLVVRDVTSGEFRPALAEAWDTPEPTT